jgi:hypothetical protein
VTDPNDLITLRDAVQRYQQEPGSWSNAYDWYRRSAQRGGTVSLGPGEVPTTKIGNKWYVSRADLSEALAAHRADIALLKLRTEDFHQNILHGIDGDTIYTEFGGYRRQGPFHFVWSTYERKTGRSDGAWYCSTCFKPTTTLHEKEECHRCRDWSPCGNDCRLSAVLCKSCDLRLDVRNLH